MITDEINCLAGRLDVFQPPEKIEPTNFVIDSIWEGRSTDRRPFDDCLDHLREMADWRVGDPIDFTGMEKIDAR